MDGSLSGGVARNFERISFPGSGDARLTAKLAATPQLLSELHALRHESYLAYGHIDRMPDGAFADRFDQSPASRSVALYSDGCLAASVRVSLYAPASGISGAGESPSTGLFRDEIDEVSQGLAREGRAVRAADISRLARHPRFVADTDLVFALYRMAGYLILDLDSDLVLVTVRPHHVRFYQRMGFRLIADPKPYPGTNAHAALMACFRSSYEGVRRAVPFMEGISAEDETFAELMGGREAPIDFIRQPLSAGASRWRAGCSAD